MWIIRHLLDRDCFVGGLLDLASLHLPLPWSLPWPMNASLSDGSEVCLWWLLAHLDASSLMLLPNPVECILSITQVEPEPSAGFTCLFSWFPEKLWGEGSLISLKWARVLSYTGLGRLGRSVGIGTCSFLQPWGSGGWSVTLIEFLPRSVFPLLALWPRFLCCFCPFSKDAGALERHDLGALLSRCLHCSALLALGL